MITTSLSTVQGTGKDPSPGKEWMLRMVRVELRILCESASRPGCMIISTAEQRTTHKRARLCTTPKGPLHWKRHITTDTSNEQKSRIRKTLCKIWPWGPSARRALLTQRGSELDTMCGELYLQPEDRRLYCGDHLMAAAGHLRHMVITWLLLATNWLGLLFWLVEWLAVMIDWGPAVTGWGTVMIGWDSATSLSVTVTLHSAPLSSWIMVHYEQRLLWAKCHH